MSRLLLCLAASETLLAACGPGNQANEPDPPVGSISATVAVDSSADKTSGAVVQVDNRAFDDMAIYMFDASHYVRLGVARGQSVTGLSVVPSIVATGPVSVQFAAYRRAGINPRGEGVPILSDPITVQQGDVVSLRIPRF